MIALLRRLFCRPRRAYSVGIVADTHYDAEPPARYHAAGGFNVRMYRRDIDMWRARIPALLSAARRAVCRDTPFILHMGDIAQGETPDAQTLAAMLEEGRKVLDDAFGGFPLRIIPGNHDVICPEGGVETYRRWFGGPTSVMFFHDGDAWMLFDSNDPPPVEEVRRWFRESEGARWTFIVTHTPLLPCCDLNRLLYGRPEQEREWRELVRLVAARRNAVVLAGHVHSMIQTVFEMPDGRISQFVMSSLWEADGLAKTKLRRIPRRKWCRKLGSVPQNERPRYAALVDEMRNHVVCHRMVHAAGHFRLEVFPDRVQIRIFGGAGSGRGRVLVLARR